MQHDDVVFFVPGEPHGKGRPRMTKAGHAYTDEKTRNYEASVFYAAMQAMNGRKPFETGCIVCLEAVFVPPKSISRKKREALIGEPVLKRPDIDNIAKSIIDGMNGVVFIDDALVWGTMCMKIWGETPGVHVRVSSNYTRHEPEKSCE